jgi:hypothetical protein
MSRIFHILFSSFHTLTECLMYAMGLANHPLPVVELLGEPLNQLRLAIGTTAFSNKAIQALRRTIVKVKQPSNFLSSEFFKQNQLF